MALTPSPGAHRGRLARQERGRAGSRQGPQDLAHDVDSRGGAVQGAPHQTGDGDGRVVVGPRDVASHVDHDHQRAADGQRRQVSGSQADDQHQEECPYELDHIILHASLPPRF